MYRILGIYGTHKTCWSWREALEWLAACGPDAIIVHRLTGVLLAQRRFKAAERLDFTPVLSRKPSRI